MHARGIRVIGRLVCFRILFSLRPPGRGGQRNRVVQTPDGGQYSGYGGFTNFADPAVRVQHRHCRGRGTRGGGRRALRLRPTTRRPASEHGLPGAARTPEHSIVEFIRETRLALEPTGRSSASVFGVAATRPLEVSQDIPAMARESDYIAPMLYPSHWGQASTAATGRASRTRSSCARCGLPQADAGHRRACGSVAPGLHPRRLVRRSGGACPDRGRAARWIDEFILWDPTVTYTSEALDPNAKATKRGLPTSRG